jgi:hypothetical protein
MATMKQPTFLSCLCLMRLCLTMAFGVPLNAQTSEGLLVAQCDGTLGTTQAGMTLEVKQETITGGYYFTANDLRDIPITGSLRDGRIVISGADGSSFDFRFKSNASEHGEELSFDNSVGLIGTRQYNGKVEKVDLRFLTMGQSTGLSTGQSPEDRRYAFTTDLSDMDFESIVRKWRLAVLSGNRKEAAKYTHFPLRVNAQHKHRTIRTPAELFAQWDRIFTPAYLSRIKKDLPHDMLGENSSLLVTLGPGDVWFGDKGIEVLNLPD